MCALVHFDKQQSAIFGAQAAPHTLHIWKMDDRQGRLDSLVSNFRLGHPGKERTAVTSSSARKAGTADSAKVSTKLLPLSLNARPATDAPISAPNVDVACRKPAVKR